MQYRLEGLFMELDEIVHVEMFIWKVHMKEEKSPRISNKLWKTVENSQNIVKNNCLQVLNMSKKLL